MQQKQIDILHKQLDQVIILLIQKQKSSVEQNGTETKHARSTRKQNLLQNLQLVQSWVSSFNSQNIGYGFNKEVPKEVVDNRVMKKQPEKVEVSVKEKMPSTSITLENLDTHTENTRNRRARQKITRGFTMEEILVKPISINIQVEKEKIKSPKVHQTMDFRNTQSKFENKKTDENELIDSDDKLFMINPFNHTQENWVKNKIYDIDFKDKRNSFAIKKSENTSPESSVIKMTKIKRSKVNHAFHSLQNPTVIKEKDVVKVNSNHVNKPKFKEFLAKVAHSYNNSEESDEVRMTLSPPMSPNQRRKTTMTTFKAIGKSQRVDKKTN